MAIVLESPKTAPERIPGDFKRDTKGTPYVSDPTGALVQSGERKGQPRWVRYGRPSGFGKQIESAWNLLKWKERQVVLGCTDPTVATMAAALLDGDRDSQEWKDRADAAAAAAHHAARSQLSADRGTHMHAVTEDDDVEADWVARAEAGRNLGVPPTAQAAMLEAWRQMLAAYDLQVLHVERKVVHDRYRLAGTLDRIVRLGRPLRFVVDGADITIPAGAVMVLDEKTGRIRRGPDGAVQWWHNYVVQLATYAGSVPYDVITEQRETWPVPIDQSWALIAHLPTGDALAGTATCSLIAVDIAAGREAAELCLAATAWEKRSDLLGVVHVGEPVVAVPVQSEPVQSEPERIDVRTAITMLLVDLQPDAAARLRALWPAGVPGFKADYTHSGEELEQILLAAQWAVDGIAVTTGEPEDRRAALAARLAALDEVATQRMRAAWPAGIAGLRTDHVHSPAELDALEAALATVEAEHEVPATRTNRAVNHVWQRDAAVGVIEGEAMVDDETFNALAARWERLDAAKRLTVDAWVRQGHEAGHGFSVRAHRSMRRLAIARAAIALAGQFDGDGDDDLARATLAVVVPDAAQLAISVGSTLGQLTQSEAEHVVEVVAMVRATDPPLFIAEDGTARWQNHAVLVNSAA